MPHPTQTSELPTLDSIKAGGLVPLPERGSRPKCDYIFDEQAILALRAARATNRPLLLRGEPGAGKSELAWAAAELLRRPLIATVVDARTEPRELLWSMDAVARLARGQTLAAEAALGRPGTGATEGDVGVHLAARLAEENFLVPGPLWWAFDYASAEAQTRRAREHGASGGVLPSKVPAGWRSADGVVLLIDEIDKADSSVPSGLLQAFGLGEFPVPGALGKVPSADPAQRSRPPLVLLTTNEERSLPDAFLRRCWVLRRDLPEGAGLVPWLVERGHAHFPSCAESVLRKAAEMLAVDRAEKPAAGPARPGLAEFLDLLAAVLAQEQDSTAQEKLLERLAHFQLAKHAPERGV